jgi:hypothetical protein
MTDDVLARERALTAAERSARRRAMRVPMLALGVCLLLFVAVVVLFVREQDDRGRCCSTS